jgi:raffinose/stachyose/melibiose transport system permease protein
MKDTRAALARIPGIAVFYLVMTAFALLYFYPMLWMFVSSLKTNGEIFRSPFALPHSPRFSNWAAAWTVGKIGRYFLNSVIVTGSACLLTLLFASMAGFALARLRFRGAALILSLFVVGLILPVQAYFIAQNYILQWLRVKDTYLALILPYVALQLPFSVYLIKAYFDAIPREILECARTDGARNFVVFSQITMPIVKPALATVGIFVTLNDWNEFLLALLYVQSEAFRTIPIGLLAFQGRYTINYQMMFAALAIVTLPMLIIYLVFQRSIVAGLTAGAVKG